MSSSRNRKSRSLPVFFFTIMFVTIFNARFILIISIINEYSIKHPSKFKRSISIVLLNTGEAVTYIMWMILFVGYLL